MLQVSIDGPIVQDWSENDDYTDLMDIALCGPHVVHGTFRTGVQKMK